MECPIKPFGHGLANRSTLSRLRVVVLAISLAILYRIFQATERTWWIWGTVFGIILVTIGNLAAPVLIEPIFNKYTPLTDPKIRDPILALARANQIPVTASFCR